MQRMHLHHDAQILLPWTTTEFPSNKTTVPVYVKMLKGTGPSPPRGNCKDDYVAREGTTGAHDTPRGRFRTARAQRQLLR